MSIMTTIAVPEGATKVVADLERCRIAPSDLRGGGRPAAGAAAGQQCGAFRLGRNWAGSSAAEFDAHMAVNVRAPMLLIDQFARSA